MSVSYLKILPIDQVLYDLPTPVFIIDKEGQIYFANKDACLLYGCNQKDLLKMNFLKLTATEDEASIFQSILQFSIELQETSGRFLGRHKNKLNKLIDVDIKWSLLKNESSSYILICVQDITELKRIERDYITKVKKLELEIEQRKKVEKTLHITHEELKEKINALETQKNINEQMLEELSTTNEILERWAIEDSLTGIYNRRYFTEYIENDIIRAQHLNKPLSLLIIDLDHFKDINDSLGHFIGDKVLIKVARIIQETIDPENILCRYGGEEFAVISLGSDISNAEKLADQIRLNISNNPIVVNDHKVNITASVGVSSIKPYQWKAPIEAIRDYLIKTADKALYLAKAKGRNKVELYRHKDIKNPNL